MRKQTFNILVTILIMSFLTVIVIFAAYFAKRISLRDSIVADNLGEESQAKEPLGEVFEADDSPKEKDDAIEVDKKSVWLENSEMIEMKIRSMSLHEKICQMIVTWPEQISASNTTQIDANGIKEGLMVYPVGGFIYFANNFVDPDQTKTMLGESQKAAMEIEELPLFMCVDEEGGNTLRIAINPSFGLEQTPAMETLQNPKDVQDAARKIGKYLAELGFNFDFAPDADVITNPLNEIIGSRSFGTDSDMVALLSKTYSDGLHEEGILSSYKHFPGHGATEGDTHEGFAFTNKTLDELRENDLVPFASAQAAGADSVMVAHISLPMVLGDNTPCTLSKEIITDLLKDELGFKGLVVTDALNMKAITENYTPAEAAVKAVSAGADIILMPPDLDAAVEAIKAAVESGKIDEARIDEAVKKILEAKCKIK